jgi:hypothetical protein
MAGAKPHTIDELKNLIVENGMSTNNLNSNISAAVSTAAGFSAALEGPAGQKFAERIADEIVKRSGERHLQ